MVRKTACQRRNQLGVIIRPSIFRDGVRVQNLATAVVRQRQNNRRSDPRQRLDLLLDFSEFDALAVDFDLPIVSSLILKLVICAPPNEITRSIKSALAVRVGD